MPRDIRGMECLRADIDAVQERGVAIATDTSPHADGVDFSFLCMVIRELVDVDSIVRGLLL